MGRWVKPLTDSSPKSPGRCCIWIRLRPINLELAVVYVHMALILVEVAHWVARMGWWWRRVRRAIYKRPYTLLSKQAPVAEHVRFWQPRLFATLTGPFTLTPLHVVVADMTSAARRSDEYCAQCWKEPS